MFKLAVQLLDNIASEKQAPVISRFIVQLCRELDTPFITKGQGSAVAQTNLYLQEISQLISDDKTIQLVRSL
jgi:hypothetical protein